MSRSGRRVTLSPGEKNRGHHEAEGHQTGAVAHRVQEHAVPDHRPPLRRHHPVLPSGEDTFCYANDVHELIY